MKSWTEIEEGDPVGKEMKKHKMRERKGIETEIGLTWKAPKDDSEPYTADYRILKYPFSPLNKLGPYARSKKPGQTPQIQNQTDTAH